MDLDNLLHEAGYVEHVQAAGLEQTIRIMESALLRQLFKAGRKAEYDQSTAQLADLRRGKGPLKISQRCKRAGRLDEYESLSFIFICQRHGQVASRIHIRTTTPRREPNAESQSAVLSSVRRHGTLPVSQRSLRV